MRGELHVHSLLFRALQDIPYLQTANEVIQVLCFGTAFRNLVLHPLPQRLYYSSDNRKHLRMLCYRRFYMILFAKKSLSLQANSTKPWLDRIRPTRFWKYQKRAWRMVIIWIKCVKVKHSPHGTKEPCVGIPCYPLADFSKNSFTCGRWKTLAAMNLCRCSSPSEKIKTTKNEDCQNARFSEKFGELQMWASRSTL